MDLNCCMRGGRAVLKTVVLCVLLVVNSRKLPPLLPPHKLDPFLPPEAKAISALMAGGAGSYCETQNMYVRRDPVWLCRFLREIREIGIFSLLLLKI